MDTNKDYWRECGLRKIFNVWGSDQLLDKVVAQILEDVKNEDLIAIYELIQPLPTDELESYVIGAD